MGSDEFWVAFNVEHCLLELGTNGLDGFEGVVFEDLFSSFIPEIFVRVEFRRIGRQKRRNRREISVGIARAQPLWLGIPRDLIR